MKGEGKKRVIIATSALSMGVHFPDVRYVVHWGPARNLLDHRQQSVVVKMVAYYLISHFWWKQIVQKHKY